MAISLNCAIALPTPSTLTDLFNLSIVPVILSGEVTEAPILYELVSILAAGSSFNFVIVKVFYL
ncbi:hypothetical protein FOD82_08760 [Lactobacillus sp. LL6]|nr:hypothetical protein FOD82_08760 [Lactobacillus sp. LL6]